jgi:hypothetical protein
VSRHRRNRDWLARMGRVPKVAPPASCTRCFKGDVHRVVVVEGDASWQAAALVRFAGIDTDEAILMIEKRLNDSDMDPGVRHQATIRLCRGCAKLTDAPVISEATVSRVLTEGGRLRAVIQPHEEDVA